MEEVQPYSDLLSRRRGTAKHRKPAFPGPAQGADLVARAQLDIHHQAATPTAAIQKVVDLCIVLALALPPPRVIAQAVIGKERSPFKALKLHAIRVEEEVGFTPVDLDSWRRGTAVRNVLQLPFEAFDTSFMKGRSPRRQSGTSW